MRAYKIMEIEGGEIKNLFRGIDGSRTLEPGKWHIAKKKVGYDGSQSKKYITGIHCVPSFEDAVEYLGNFRDLENRAIVEVYIQGNRPKPTNDKVILADAMLIPESASIVPAKEVA